jgi:hypothetical protein
MNCEINWFDHLHSWSLFRKKGVKIDYPSNMQQSSIMQQQQSADKLHIPIQSSHYISIANAQL